MVWLWAVALLALVVIVILLVTGRQWRDPAAVYRYETDTLKETGDIPVLFRETESIDPGLELITAIAVQKNRIFAAGAAEETSCCLLLAADNAETGRIPLPETPQCLAPLPEGGIAAGFEKELYTCDLEGNLIFRTGILDEEAYLTSVVADEENIFAADAGRRVVLRLNRKGEVTGRIGEKDPEKDIPGLIVPSPYCDVALDSNGALWVVNPGRHGIEQYRPDGSLVTSWYRPSMKPEGFCGCCNPAHIAFWKDEGLITAEKGVGRLKLYRLDWSLAGMVALPEAFAVSKTADLGDDHRTPFADIAVDTAGRVLAADHRKNLIRVFEYTGAGQ
jgi:hypothetical protein